MVQNIIIVHHLRKGMILAHRNVLARVAKLSSFSSFPGRAQPQFDTNGFIGSVGGNAENLFSG